MIQLPEFYKERKIIDVSSNQVGDVKGNATLIIFSTMPPWLSVHMGHAMAVALQERRAFSGCSA